MNTELLYGKSGIRLDLPEDSLIIEPKSLPKLENVEEAIRQALRNPIGTAPLRESVASTDTVSIVISDITRPTPNHILVPLLIEELPHVPLENFVIINGTGTHRDQTREEFVQMLGAWVVDNIRIVNNHVMIKRH